jgi:hypothetical protein
MEACSFSGKDSNLKSYVNPFKNDKSKKNLKFFKQNYKFNEEIALKKDARVMNIVMHYVSNDKE